MAKILLLCLFSLSHLFGDINFDALEAKKPVQSSISMDFSDGVKAGNKEWKKKEEENRIERERLARQRPKSYASNYEYCSTGDTCYQLLSFKKSGAAIIRCIKGPSTGKEKCLSYHNKKYATGCGMTSSFAHHHSLEKAGNLACEY